MAGIVYFSSASGNTHRFIEKLGQPAQRIPLYSHQEPLLVTEPYVLVVPSYGGGPKDRAVPKQVVRFLNEEQNRTLIRGVIGAGNTNFGEAFCLAALVISHKCQVPVLYKFEVFGTPEDVVSIRKGLEQFWTQH